MAKKYVEIDGVKMEVKKAKKPFYKRIWVWGLGLIIVASIASGGGNDEETKTTKAQEPKTAAVQKDQKKEEVKAYGIGQVASVGDVDFTVTKVSETNVIQSNNQFQPDAKTDGKFVLVDITVKNGKKNALSVIESFFKIKANGAEYKPSTNSDVSIIMSMKNKDGFFYKEINPGLSNKGTVVFELPADVDLSKAVIQCQTGAWGTETIDINLK